MFKNTRLDEKMVKNIIKQKTKCTDDNYKFDLTIYFKGTKMKNCIIKNSLSNNWTLQMSHGV